MKNSTSRLIPKGYAAYRQTDKAIVYKKDGELIAMCFVGKQSKPGWHIRFISQESMDKRCADLFNALDYREEQKKKRKQVRKDEVQNTKIGDLFYNSWGYDQTNIDFYQVVKKTKSAFVIREIKARFSNRQGASHMAGYFKPVRDSFCGDEIIKTSFSMDHGILSKTIEDADHYASWYA